MAHALRYMQREAIDAIFAYWGEEDGNPLVDMATGTGKSITMAQLIKELIEGWATLRVFNVAHREELVEGNYAEFVGLSPFADAGIFAASLGRREAHRRVTFGQIQTVYNKAQVIGHIDVLVIDEVHLVPPDAETQYGQFIRELLEINPDMKIVGFSATPYRLDSGRLDEGENRMFDKVVYTYSITQGIEDGYLAPLSSKGMTTAFDLTGVGSLGGDYKKGALAAAVDKDEITRLAVAEAVAYGKDKRTALFFCSGVDHANHVRDEVRRHGRTCETLTGNTPKGERRRIIAALKSGDLWGCTNDAVLTVGTNIPGVDLIADLAPTKSTSRFVQKAGRGTRPVYPPGFHPDGPGITADDRRAAIANGPKPSCLYLDFAKNVSYHGPVDQAQPRIPGSGQGEAPVKQCPTDKVDVEGKKGCDELLPISIMTCPCCGYIFPPSTDEKLTRTADSTPILSTEKPWYPVTSREFAPHPGKIGDDGVQKPTTVKVTYTVDGRKRAEWLCPGHAGYAKSKADKYWRLHNGKTPFPKSADEFLERAGELLATTEVQLDFSKSSKFPEFIGHRAGPGSYATEVEVRGGGSGNLGAVLGRRVPVSIATYHELADGEDVAQQFGKLRGDAERARVAALMADMEDQIPF